MEYANGSLLKAATINGNILVLHTPNFNQLSHLRGTLDDLSFICGADLQEEVSLLAEVDGVVYEKMQYYNEPTGRLYYYANLDNICVLATFHLGWIQKIFYPQFDNCGEKP